METIVFEQKLTRATIVKRPNRFIMEVRLENGEIVKAHCPTTGAIGNANLDELPCLLSGPYGEPRATKYTVEALSFYDFTDPNFQWIGINQTAANKYVADAIEKGLLDTHSVIAARTSVKREPRLGPHRLDFLIDDNFFIEVKTPLRALQTNIPEERVNKKSLPTSVNRMIGQVSELTKALAQGQKAIMIVAFMYDNPGFKVPKSSNAAYSKISETMGEARDAGLETWQVNFSIDEEKVCFLSFEKIS